MTTKAELTRLLFVEDEEGIRLTLAPLLTKNGFDVTSVATVREALTQINCMHYDVLLCDLNIEKPADGFVVISAMRYAQPECISLVLTAYPSFENAMEAIQHQVDEFFTKPADVNTLVKRINIKLEARRSRIPVPFKRLSSVLRENCKEVVAAIWSAIETDAVLSVLNRSSQRGAELSRIMDALIEYVELGRNGLKSEALELGAEHGIRRKKQGYDARMIVREFQLISEQICELMASDRMPAAPVGLTVDLMKLTKGLNTLLMEALKAFVNVRQASRV
jgi:ActR/RegA family two-component response regulator